MSRGEESWHGLIVRIVEMSIMELVGDAHIVAIEGLNIDKRKTIKVSKDTYKEIEMKRVIIIFQQKNPKVTIDDTLRSILKKR